MSVAVACAHSSTPGAGAVSAAQAWESATCDPASPDTTGWTRYHLGRVSIAVPPAYRPRAPGAQGPNLVFGRGDATLVVSLANTNRSAIDRFYHGNVKSVRCTASFGGYGTDAVAWQLRNTGFSGANTTYQAELIWQGLNAPDEPSTVTASIKTTRLSDAVALREALHTIAVDPATSRSQLDRFQASLDSLVPALLEELATPGAAVALFRDGKVVVAKGYGWANREKQQQVTTRTLFNIGSISKTVASWGLLRLVQEGKLDLDAPVDRYLTRWHLPQSAFNRDGVTLRRLLSHTAGLSLSGYPGFEPGEPLPTIEESLSGRTNGPGDVRLVMEPGAKWQYSGGGYTIAQLLVEEVTGRRFNDYMREAVFPPLGMTSSSYVWDAMVDARAAQPYGAVSAIPGPRFTAQAAASLQTSLDDFIRFAQASMSSERSEYATTVLRPETVRSMQQPVPPSPNYGLGYGLATIDETRLAGHGGANDGWQARFLVSPASGDGLIVMTNASLGFEVYDQLFCAWEQALGGAETCARGIAAVMASAIARSGAADAVTLYRRIKAEATGDYNFDEDQLNSLGYVLLREKRVDDAISMFRLNVEAFPDAFNPYDSLGEALLVRGDSAAAIANYRKSVELNPANENGKSVLRRLGIPPDNPL
jgi:CubicO group peptidase (beta-lactamase class C family)